MEDDGKERNGLSPPLILLELRLKSDVDGSHLRLSLQSKTNLRARAGVHG